jgi:hypothetical protein
MLSSSWTASPPSSGGGSLALEVAGRSIVVPVDRIAGLRPVASCSLG